MELTVEQALQQGIAAHKEGKLRDAERLYRAIIQSQPAHPDANHNLGVLAVSINKADAALPLFKIALEANPKIEQFWLSYIDALIKQKHFDNAKQVLEQAKKQGVAGNKLNVLGVQLASINEPENFGSVSPSQEQLSTLLEHYQNGRFGEAEKLAISLTKEFPKHQFGWKILGAVFGQSGRNSEAVNANQKAVALSSQDADAHNNLGITLQKLGRLDEAEASYTQAIVLKPDFAEAHSNLGATLKELGRLDEAEASFRQAIALKPDYAEAHSNLGNTLQNLGRLDEAEASYTQAIGLKPDYGEAHRHLTTMKKFVFKDKQYLKMQELYFDKDISEEQRCHINFGLAKAFEDLGDFKQAFAHYSEGNILRKNLLKYDINKDAVLFKQIKSNYERISRNSLEHGKLTKTPMPIFIVGMPRSGTTLVEQIISSHPRVTGAGELSFIKQSGGLLATVSSEINNASLLDFRENYLKKIQHIAKGNSIVTDKMPQNFLFIGLISAAFPEAKIVHVKRNPAAVCWANYKQYFVSKTIGYCYALEDVISYYRLYENLMEFWGKSLSKRIYNLDYELLVESQESETRQVIDYLGLDWDEKCLSPQDNTRSVATASNMQVRKKVYRGSSQQWKKYEPFLNGTLDCLLLP